jgi:hypothetical protein
MNFFFKKKREEEAGDWPETFLLAGVKDLDGMKGEEIECEKIIN